jgi:hypothetical protein
MSKTGYSTSMGFRKSKHSANIDLIETDVTEYKLDKINFNLNDMLSNVDGMSGVDGAKKFSEILLEIKREENDSKNSKSMGNKEGEVKESKRQSDDEISEGSSDNESSKDDLHESALKELLAIIKENKIRNGELKHTKVKAVQYNLNRKLKTMYDIEREPIE